jgi:IclR family pca regulon transcriptional regulator
VKVMHVELSPGARLPAFAHTMGRVLLAALPDDDLERVLAGMATPRITPFTVQGRDALRERIAQARAQGWAFAQREIDERYACVAVPLVDQAGVTLAALNVGMPVARATPAFIEHRVLPELRQAAETISRSL